MNWKDEFLNATLILLMAGFSACDSFESDVQPQGEQELDVKSTISALPGTSLFIDLKRSIYSSGAVRVQIHAHPTKGTANIESNAILRYDPRPEFVSGHDFFSLDLIDAQGSVVDTDSIFIALVQSEDSLPCFNGALSDFYSTRKDQPVILTPLQNDGYCDDQASGAVIDFKSEPSNGSFEQIALFTYSYTPESGFVGKDTFMYELELIDKEGNSSYSMAKITVEVYQDVPADCDSIVYPFHHVLEKPLEEFYLFEPLHSDSLCEVSEWTVDSLHVQNGEGQVTSEGWIKYFPGIASEDYITYRISFGDKIYHNYMTVAIEQDSINICPEAYEDEFYLHIIEDSIGTSKNPYILPPANNDVYCSDNFTIRILEDPAIGVASVHNEQKIKYYADEEFTGIIETSLFYEMCDIGRCDSAYVHLTLERAN